MARRARGFSYEGRGPGRVRVLSSKASDAVGRPSPRIWSAQTVQNVSNTTKAAVRRVFRRDPAKGILGPGGDVITNTNIEMVSPNPRIVSRAKTAPPGAGQTRVRDSSANRRIDKR